MNKYIAKGNVTFDPELRRTATADAVVDFTLAINKKWKDRSGENKESVVFPRFSVWGLSGENFAQYVKKGDAILVDAEYTQNSWETAEGEKKTNHGFRVNSWEFAGGRNGNNKVEVKDEDDFADKPAPKLNTTPKRGRPPKAQPVVAVTNTTEKDEDIPF